MYIRIHSGAPPVAGLDQWQSTSIVLPGDPTRYDYNIIIRAAKLTLQTSFAPPPPPHTTFPEKYAYYYYYYDYRRRRRTMWDYIYIPVYIIYTLFLYDKMDEFVGSSIFILSYFINLFFCLPHRIYYYYRQARRTVVPYSRRWFVYNK